MKQAPAHAYAAFVDRTMKQVAIGLETEEHYTNTATVIDKVRSDPTESAGSKTLLMRYMLGQEDPNSYLQAGLSMLWSIDSEEKTLTPDALYRPDGSSGIRAGLLKALKKHRAHTKEDAPALLLQFLKMVMQLFNYAPTDPQFGVVDAFLRSLTIVEADAHGSAPPFKPNIGIQELMQSSGEIVNWLKDSKLPFPNQEMTTVRAIMLAFKEKIEEGMNGPVVNVLELFNHDVVDALKDGQLAALRTEKNEALASAVKAAASAEQARSEAKAANAAKDAEAAKRLQAEEASKQAKDDAAILLAKAKKEASDAQQANGDGLVREIELQKALEQQATLVSQLQEEYDAVIEEKERVNAVLEVVKQELQGMQSEVKESEERVLNAESYARRKVQARIVDLETRNDQLNRQSQALRRELDEAEGGLQRANEENAQFREFVQSLQRQLREAIGREQELREELEALQLQLVQLQEEASVEARFRSDNQKQLDDNRRETARIQRELEGAMQDKQQAEDALEKLKAEVEAIKKDDESKSDDGDEVTPSKWSRLLGIVKSVLEPSAEDDSGPDGPFPTLAHAWLKKHAVGVAFTRGLVGQRGPLCRDSKCESTADNVLRFDCMVGPKCAKSMSILNNAIRLERVQLARNHGEGVETAARTKKAMSARNPQNHTNSFALASALHAIRNNVAVVGRTPAHEHDDRGGIERAYEVRWLPQGRSESGAEMASAAVLEHVHATCLRTFERMEDDEKDAKAVLAQVCVTAKLMQAPMLVSLNRRAAHLEDGVQPPTDRLVTRPCAVMGGKVLFPERHSGIALVPNMPLEDTPDQHYAVKTHLDPLIATSRRETLEMHRSARNSKTATSVSTYADIDPNLTPFVPRPLAPIGAPAGVPALFAPHDANMRELMHILDDVENVDIDTFLDHIENAVSKMATLIATDVNNTSQLSQCNTGGDPVEAFLNEQIEREERMGETSTVVERRTALQTEFLRNTMVSTDRLWMFIRMLSGFIGDDVNSILTMADEQAVRANKALQEQRTQIAKRITDMQSKIVETVVTGLMKDSKLSIDKDGASGEMVIINSETRARLDELAKGEAGRPFFEANVAFQHLVKRTERENESKTTLAKLLTDLSETGRTMISNLESTLNTESLGGGPSLLELSHPVNSLFVHIKPDAMAAMRNGLERMNVELSLRQARRMSLWEVCEGGNTTLTNRFCDLVGHVLVQARSSTGSTAMYISQNAIILNAMQANVALSKAVDFAEAYSRHVPPPSLPSPSSSASDVKKLRNQYMTSAVQVKEGVLTNAINRKRGFGGGFGSNKNLRAAMLQTAGTPLYAHVSSSGFGRYP